MGRDDISQGVTVSFLSVKEFISFRIRFGIWDREHSSIQLSNKLGINAMVEMNVGEGEYVFISPSLFFIKMAGRDFC